ncbi:hypothetical protein PMIN07_009989 [Paraphaeosphaeria minitans]
MLILSGPLRTCLRHFHYAYHTRPCAKASPAYASPRQPAVLTRCGSIVLAMRAAARCRQRESSSGPDLTSSRLPHSRRAVFERNPAIPQSRNPSLFASREKRVPDLTWGCMSVRLREQPSSLSIVVHRDDRTPSLTAPKHAPTNAPCCSSSTAGRALAICMPSCNSAQPHGNPADRLTPFDGGPLSFIGTNTTASPEPGEWLRHPTRAAQALYSVTVLPNASFTLRSSRLTHPALEVRVELVTSCIAIASHSDASESSTRGSCSFILLHADLCPTCQYPVRPDSQLQIRV